VLGEKKLSNPSQRHSIVHQAVQCADMLSYHIYFSSSTSDGTSAQQEVKALDEIHMGLFLPNALHDCC
jgi:hypothetical protein